MGMFDCFSHKPACYSRPVRGKPTPTAAQRAAMDKQRLPLGPSSPPFSEEAHLTAAREWLAHVDAGRIGAGRIGAGVR
jgi:hypothetical protein